MASKFLGKNVIITKMLDEAFEGNHPNQVNEGAQFDGRLLEFGVGTVAYVDMSTTRAFRTSTITLIDEEAGVFETQNSVYKIELHPYQIDENEMSKSFTDEVEKMEGDAPDVEGGDVEAPHYGNGEDDVIRVNPRIIREIIVQEFNALQGDADAAGPGA